MRTLSHFLSQGRAPRQLLPLTAWLFVLFNLCLPAAAQAINEDAEDDAVRPYRPWHDALAESAAAAGISGSPQLGLQDHLLQRPLPEDGTSAGATAMTITLHYPSIGHKAVDADIRAWAAGIADAFTRHFDSGALAAAPPTVDLRSTYTVDRPSRHAVSITFELWNDTGGMHPNLDVLTLNYSLITGQRLALADIFADPDEAMRLMSAWSRRTLLRRLGVGQLRAASEGLAPLVENFSSLTLVPEGVCINFQPYQVTGWEMGVQKVLMPLAELAPAGPFSILWAGDKP